MREGLLFWVLELRVHAGVSLILGSFFWVLFLLELLVRWMLARSIIRCMEGWIWKEFSRFFLVFRVQLKTFKQVLCNSD